LQWTCAKVVLEVDAETKYDDDVVDAYEYGMPYRSNGSDNAKVSTIARLSTTKLVVPSSN